MSVGSTKVRYTEFVVSKGKVKGILRVDDSGIGRIDFRLINTSLKGKPGTASLVCEKDYPNEVEFIFETVREYCEKNLIDFCDYKSNLVS